MLQAAVVYDSKTGNTAQAAQYIAEGLAKEGLQARTFVLAEVDADYVRKSDVVIFGSPTYMASVTADMAAWLQKNGGSLNLAGKLGGAFATEQWIHGGADLAMQTIMTHELVFGMLVYSGGSSLGKPVIHLGPAGMSPHIENFAELFRIYGQRMAAEAKKVFADSGTDEK